MNPNLNIDIHHVAVSNEYKTVGYKSGMYSRFKKNIKREILHSMFYAVAGCNGCGNGGISQAEDTSYAVEAVRLLPYLQQHYSQHFIDQICLVKIDTEVTRTQLFATGGEYD